jgi:hypothetical protein
MKLNKLEVKDLLERIKQHYQEFIVDDFKLDEWYSELQYYDAVDVHKKLEEHMRGDYGNSIPKLYFLTRYLIKEQDKSKYDKTGLTVRCDLCGKIVGYSNYKNHHDRCESIDYLNNNSLKFYGREVEKDILYRMTDEKFDSYYWNCCYKIYEKLEDGLEKRVLKNALLSHEGKDVVETFDKLAKDL